jgi:outer membrane protein OmpA-like peptidoglycan-associated protein
MIRVASAALVVVFASACHCHPRIVQSAAPPTQAAPPLHDIIALLPDPETGTVGRAIVSSPVGGSVELTGNRAATRVEMGKPPSAAFTFSEAQVQQLFGDALSARPPAARHFLLYFEIGSNRLTPEGEKLFADILAFVQSRPVPDLSVVGHTDTTGTAQANIELGRNRAAMIRDRLVAAGLDGSVISAVSHGEADLLVPTPDETPEPRNRRVEVSVR